MAISDRLTKLSEDITSAYKSINDLGGTIPAHKNTENISVAIDSIYNRLPKVSGTGSDITLTPTLKGRLGSVPKGNTYQFTTTGKNVWNILEILSGTNITTNDNEEYELETSATVRTYSINGEANTSYTIDVTINADVSDMALNFVYSDNTTEYIGEMTSSSYQSKHFSKTSNSSKTLTGIKVSTYSYATKKYYTFVQPIVVKGSTVGDYEPYTNGASPNPSYPQDIQCVEGIQNISICGKNLLPLTNQSFSIGSLNYNVENGKLKMTGSRNSEVLSNNINFKNNFSFTLKAGTYITYFNKSGTNTGNLILSIKNKSDDIQIKRLYETAGTFTLSEDTEVYLGLYSYQLEITETVVFEIQLEKGSTSTSYQPYQTPQTQEINLGDIKLYDGDKITGTPDNWSVVRENGEVVLTGSNDENWQLANNTDDYLYFQTAIIDDLINTDVSDAFIDRFSKLSSWNAQANGYIILSNARHLRIRIDKTLLSDVSSINNAINSFKTWLSTHNTKVVYKLETPTTTPITDTYLISQLNALYNAKSYDGQTNISVDGQLPMILEVSALKGA